MKTQFFAFLSFACFAAFGEATTNEVLFVDGEGNVNRPETLATTAQMAANKAAILTAEQKAAAAEAAAREGTNLVRDLIRDITANELVIYRQGFTDAFGVAVIIDPSAELVVSSFKPLDTIDDEGRQAFELEYRLFNSQAISTKPIVKYAPTIANGRDGLEPLPASQVSEPVGMGTETDENGKVWHKSRIVFHAAQGTAGFFIINLTADDAAGDGWTFDLPHGVKGGLTVDWQFGSRTLEFVGGLCMGVK